MSGQRRRWPAAAVAVMLLAGPAAAAQDHAVEDHAAQDQPKLLPTRDVDITYDVTRPQQPRTRERVRWLAGEHLERVDSSGRSTTIFDRNAHEVTLLTPANRTYRKLERSAAPGAGAGARGDSQAWQRCGRCRIAVYRLVVDGGRGNAHRLRDHRRRYAAPGGRRSDLLSGALGEICAAKSRAFPGAAELRPGASSGRRRRALRTAEAA